MKKPNAQALIAVILLLAVLGIFVGALGTMWEAELKTRTLERDGMQALYLAQAGMERGKTWVSNNITANGCFPTPCVSPPSLPGWYYLPTSVVNQRYRFVITDLGADLRLIESYGEVLDSNGNLLASRALQVQIQGIGTGGGGDPKDNDAITSGSWREF